MSARTPPDKNILTPAGPDARGGRNDVPGAASSGEPAAAVRAPLHRDISPDDTRRMAPVYVAVVIVEALVLLFVWWFQEYFG